MVKERKQPNGYNQRCRVSKWWTFKIVVFGRSVVFFFAGFSLRIFGLLWGVLIWGLKRSLWFVQRLIDQRRYRSLILVRLKLGNLIMTDGYYNSKKTDDICEDICGEVLVFAFSFWLFCDVVFEFVICFGAFRLRGLLNFKLTEKMCFLLFQYFFFFFLL